MAASIILGGVAGGAIGDHLRKSDTEKHAETNLRALDSLGKGQSESWSDARTRNSGSTTVTNVAADPDGNTCKSYVETVRTGPKTVTKDGMACRAPGGTWRVARAKDRSRLPSRWRRQTFHSLHATFTLFLQRRRPARSHQAHLRRSLRMSAAPRPTPRLQDLS